MSNFLPNELVKRLNEEEGFDSEAFNKAHQQGDKITSIRLNSFKQDAVSFENVSPVPWCDKGYYLAERPVFTLDPLYHAGCYYVQEASSMFIAHILKEIGLENSSIRALDLCAAPGGKSTLLVSYLGSESLLVSNEVIKSRANILADNIVRWGTTNVVVTNNDPSAFSRLPGYFDLLLVDAPCSGSGMFRKDQNAVDEWSLANVKLCSDRQKRILAESLDALVTDGYLIYSTCSYSREENEDILDWLSTEYALETISITRDSDWDIEETQSAKHKAIGYRFYPHKLRGEGFFVAVLQKKERQLTFNRKKTKFERNAVPPNVVSNWIEGSQNHAYFMHGDHIHIIPKNYEDDIKWLQQVLYIKQAGTNIGKWTGRELLPSHDLACSVHIKKNLAVQDVTLDVALQFLRKESLDRVDFTAVKSGWCLVQYKGVNLGWIKVLSNRINNYYPKEVRIMNL
ncbi:methyltransferase RsmF C-terminal domain-like protein [Sphingobacterium sp. SGR-19]|uniref:methyltransferase RsmF C-terminal domain-like protein n=1 Tax=Sphingobacterium sp. SGR-19 TaxID=2710886 RepID=UPI0013EDA0D1|nr:RNA methyltransferase [Sphingobacterium sp. SGR-19]NGM67301.1 RNA methyltransferase [Sphingobacterium sp. SGR-19]